LLHEIKYDGYRLRVERHGDRVRLITRGGYDWTIIVQHPEKLTENIVRVGVNYKFGWGAPVVANY